MNARQGGQAGFTLIELVVVVGVMVLVSAAILANHSQYGGQVLLQNLAYDVALSVREAQVYGISVQRFGPNTFSAGYGAHFDLSSPATYLIFADAVTPDGLYDQGELVKAISIDRGYYIKELCGTPSNGTEDCSLQKLDVLFKRPDPDAWIAGGSASCILNNAACEASARLVISSPRGDTMSVTVEANGQISVSKTATIVP